MIFKLRSDSNTNKIPSRSPQIFAVHILSRIREPVLQYSLRTFHSRASIAPDISSPHFQQSLDLSDPFLRMLSQSRK